MSTLVFVLVASACGSDRPAPFAVYDWEAQRADGGATTLECRANACPDRAAREVSVDGAPALAGDDLERDSVKWDADPQTGQPVVLLRFTGRGTERFRELTRRLAQRGALRGRPQHLLLVVDGTVYAAPYVDYRRNPEGIRGDNGVQLSPPTAREARRVVKALRG